MAGGVDTRAATRAALFARMQAFLASSGTLKLPSSTRPDVSIILILHNQAELTFGCLTSIIECLSSADVRVETVIFDNNSTDLTDDVLARISGASVIKNPENLHFLQGVNRAARTATGRHLLLFNNDAQLMPGTVEAALRTIEGEPDVGAVGGRIVLPDGTLQEAGSIVWNDGTCTGYARGCNPTDPEAMFRRDVDYCSGAFLMTPRCTFERLGGFDERYSPAYYEETDYCLRLWRAGLRVVYEPDVLILHYEFGSASATDEALDLQRRNHRIFFERHQDWLAGQLPYRRENTLAARRANSGAKRVLMIEDRVPHERLGSGYPRANHLLRELARTAEVTLFPMFGHNENWRDRLWLINAFAVVLLTLLGAAGEALGYDRMLKTNTAKRRTHSLFRQGCLLYDLIPTMRDDWLRPLMQRFSQMLHEQPLFADVFGPV